MVSLSRNDIVRPVAGSLLGLWLAGAALLTTLVALLSLAIMNDPIPSQDLAVMDWVRGWHLPGLAGFFQVVSGLTSKWGARDWAWQGRHSCFCWAKASCRFRLRRRGRSGGYRCRHWGLHSGRSRGANKASRR